MRLLKVLFALAFTASISSFAQAQQASCEWRLAGGGSTPDGGWVRAEVCLTVREQPYVRSIATRTTTHTGSCTLNINTGYRNIRGCRDALIVPAVPVPAPAPTPTCASGHTWTYQTSPSTGGDSQAAAKCGGNHCGYSVAPVMPVTYPLLRYTCS